MTVGKESDIRGVAQELYRWGQRAARVGRHGVRMIYNGFDFSLYMVDEDIRESILPETVVDALDVPARTASCSIPRRSERA